MIDVLIALVVGFAAGVAAGLFGVGGGILFSEASLVASAARGNLTPVGPSSRSSAA